MNCELLGMNKSQMRDLRFSLRWNFKSWSSGASPWRRTQQGPLKSWYPTTTLRRNPELDLSNSQVCHTEDLICRSQISVSVPREVSYSVTKSYRHSYFTCDVMLPIKWNFLPLMPTTVMKPVITWKWTDSSRFTVTELFHLNSSHYIYMRVCPKVSGLAAWSENCKWYSSLPPNAVVSLFRESVEWVLPP